MDIGLKVFTVARQIGENNCGSRNLFFPTQVCVHNDFPKWKIVDTYIGQEAAVKRNAWMC